MAAAGAEGRTMRRMLDEPAGRTWEDARGGLPSLTRASLAFPAGLRLTNIPSRSTVEPGDRHYLGNLGWNAVMLPNFLLIGAAKSGTTSLYRYLGQHPEIFMSPIKEPNFFAFDGQLPSFAGPVEPATDRIVHDRLRREKYLYSVVARPAYERLFSQAGGRKIRGEASTAYLTFPGTAKRIKEMIPDARIVAVLRNPVDRAYSKYYQARRDGVEPIDDFRAAIDAESQRKIEGWTPTLLYMYRGYYHKQLSCYYNLFERSQILVGLYDDLCRDPASFLKTIFEFAGVDPNVHIDTREWHNVSAIRHDPRSGVLYQLTVRPFRNSAALKSVIPASAVSRIRPWVSRLLLKPVSPPPVAPLAPDLRDRLTALFRDDIEQLQTLIRRDLSHWLGAASAPMRPEKAPPGEAEEGHRQVDAGEG
jgi:hypothetical protein